MATAQLPWSMSMKPVAFRSALYTLYYIEPKNLFLTELLNSFLYSVRKPQKSLLCLHYFSILIDHIDHSLAVPFLCKQKKKQLKKPSFPFPLYPKYEQ